MSQLAANRANLGHWEGTFYHYGLPADGDATYRGEVKSTLDFEEMPNGVMRQANQYGDGRSVTFEYWEDENGLHARQLAGDTYKPFPDNFLAGMRFFEDGWFTNGAADLSDPRGFAMEQGFRQRNEKLRVMVLYEADGSPKQATLMRERNDGPWSKPAGDLLDAAALDRPWETESEEVYERLPETPIAHPPTTTYRFGGNSYVRTPAKLPVSSVDRSFTVEMGWLVEPNTLYTIERRYDRDGRWAKTVRSVKKPAAE